MNNTCEVCGCETYQSWEPEGDHILTYMVCPHCDRQTIPARTLRESLRKGWGDYSYVGAIARGITGPSYGAGTTRSEMYESYGIYA
jgi:hypothetical protein